MSSRLLAAVVVPLLLAAAEGARADVAPNPLFTDHAVLQKAADVPVWGKAAPGEAVTVTYGTASATATAGDDGKWKAVLDLRAAGPEPHDLVMQGKTRAVAADVVVGEVWLASGQSNMDFALSRAKTGEAEIAAAGDPLFRAFRTDRLPSHDPVDEAKGKWVVADPKTVGQWTAVGYLFGKRLRQELGVPVGLIDASFGGTYVEAWTPADALATDPDLKAGMEKVTSDFVNYGEFAARYREWEKKYGREDKPAAPPENFVGPTASEEGWKPIKLPGTLAEAGIPDCGAIWLRKKLTFLPENAGKPLSAKHGIDLFTGEVHDSVTVYLNGKQVAKGDVDDLTHRHGFKGDDIAEGPGILAYRVFAPAGGAAVLVTKAARFAAGGMYGGYALSGDWEAKVEYELPPPEAEAKAAYPQRTETPQFTAQNIAAYLFNGMIHPLVPYALAGVIWYQGEANTGMAAQYQTTFPLLISSWRAHWGRGDFPFFFCQLPGFSPIQADAPPPAKSGWAELREAEAKGALALPNTGMAVLADFGVGEPGDIHPRDKATPGDRLARLALNRVYGKKTPDAGPAFESMAYEGDAIRVRFRNAEGGLVAKPLPATYLTIPSDPGSAAPVPLYSPGSEVQGFYLCGDDGVWKWAAAKIDGASVLVSAPGVAAPREVRYAWAQYPVCNLFNKDGLPAEPFRTDAQPRLSDKVRYGDVAPSGPGNLPTPGAAPGH